MEKHAMWLFVGCVGSIWALGIRSEISRTLSQDHSQRQGQRQRITVVTDTTSDNTSITSFEQQVWKQATVRCVPLTDHISCYQNVTFIVKSHGHGCTMPMDKICDFENELQLQVIFFAFNRTFNLAISRHFKRHLNITLVGTQKQARHINHTLCNYFSGVTTGEPSSFYGIYEDGMLDGILEIIGETYYFEPMDTYFEEISSVGRYTLVAYKEKDIAVSKRLNVRWRQTRQCNNWIGLHALPGPIHKTPSKHTVVGGKFQHIHRQKKAVATPYRVCELKIIVDYNFYNIYCGHSIKRVVREVAYSVSTSDSIFRNVDFDSNGIADNIGFAISKILIFENDSFPTYYLGQGNNPHVVLSEFTRYDFSEYCLGVLMTYRDFKDGVIGLAFPGKSSMYSAAGGICQNRLFSYKSIRSFNTLLVTPINFGRLIPRRMFALTLAHELGHSFGSGHDPKDDKICHPLDIFDLYIMNEKTTYYTRPNNDKFSPCSLKEMGPVVALKATCLKVYDAQSLCGNFLIDPGEECDCGPTADACERFDPCCVTPQHGQPGCRVPRELNKHCSPQTSPCCTRNCTIEPNPVVCRASTECSGESKCDTASAECPNPMPLADGKLCRSGTRVCHQGLCGVSRCTHHGWEDCQCHTTEEELCELCCKPANATQADCVPAYKLVDDDAIVQPIYRFQGELCYDGTGYCGAQHHCYIVKPIDYDGVFAKVFQPSAKEQMSEWVSNYWYFVFVGTVLLISIVNFLHAFYHRTEPPAALALMSAKMTVLWDIVDYKYLTLDEQLQHLHRSYEMKLADLGEGKPMDMIVGISRLQHFFPMTPRRVVVEVVSNSSCEEFAVRCLLLKGYPLKVAIFDEDMQNEESIDDEMSSIKRTDDSSSSKVCSDETITTITIDVEEVGGNTFTSKQTVVEETFVQPYTNRLTTAFNRYEVSSLKTISTEDATTTENGVMETGSERVAVKHTSFKGTLVVPFTNELTPVDEPPILHRHQ